MNINKFIKKNKIAVSWFFSYILVLAITLVTNVYMYKKIETNIEHQINISNLEILNNKKQYIDNEQKNISNIATNLLYDVSVQDMAAESIDDLQFNTDIGKIRTQISNRIYSGISVSSVFVYFPNKDFIVSNSGGAKSKIFFDAYYGKKNISYEDFRNMLSEKRMGRYFEIADISGAAAKGNVLCVFSAVNMSGAVVGVEVPYAQFANYSNETDNKFLCILDKDNNVIFSDKERSEAESVIGGAADKLRLNEAVLYKDKFFLTVKSEENNWKYTFVIDSRDYMSQLYALRGIMTVLMILYALACVAVAYFMTVRNHKPIRILADRITKRLNDNCPDDKSYDEMQYINALVTQIIEENEAYNSKAAIQELALRDAVFMKLLHGETVSNDVSVQTMLSGAGIDFRYRYFTVVLFYIEDCRGIFFESEENNSDEAENYRLARFIITNILKDLINPNYMSVFCDTDGMLCCVVNSDKRNITGELFKTISETKRFTLENFNVDFVAGISESHETAEQLVLCHNEAMECLECKFFDYSDVITYSSIKESGSGSMYYFPIEKEFKMINFLKSAEYDKSVEILDEVFRVNFENSMPSVQLAKCLTYEIAGITAKVLNDIDAGYDMAKIFERIDSCRTVDAMKNEIKKIFAEICEKNSAGVSRVARIVEQSKEYIQTHYANPNLNGAMIAEHFGVNYTYMSTVFKKQTQEGMLNYITNVRVEKAANLLRTTNLTVKQIAADTGYTSERTFSRAFVKIMGVTPGDFKKNVKEKNRH